MIALRRNTRYKIHTSTGYQYFSGVRRTTKEKILNFKFEDGSSIKCSLDHLFFSDNKEVLAKKLKPGDRVGVGKTILSIAEESHTGYLYDPVGVENGSEYLSDGGVSSHNCDFSTSGATVIEPEILKWYESQLKSPIERRWMDSNYWIWEYPDYTKTYATIVDISRGDGKDFSTIQVMDVEEAKQVAEYRGQPDTRELGRLAVQVATEWNMSLLIIENTGIGWDVIQTAVEMQYPNLYYSPRSDQALTNVEIYLNRFDKGDGMVPGFSTNLRTRPLVISKLTSYLHDRGCIIQSKRTHAELSTFVWKAGKAQAQEGYNDDLVIPWGIGLFLRDTALRFRQIGVDLAKASLEGMYKSQGDGGVYLPSSRVSVDPWAMNTTYGGKEDLRWLL